MAGNSVSAADQAEAAMCIWEEILSRKERNPAIARHFEHGGTGAMRLFAMSLAIPCHLAWEKAVAETGYDDPFDWEFVPDWLTANVDWDGGAPTLKGKTMDNAVTRRAARDASARAYDPFGYFARKAAREAAIRAAAPYLIDGKGPVIPDFETLEKRLQDVGLGVLYEARSDGSFAIVDLMTGSSCGRVITSGFDTSAIELLTKLGFSPETVGGGASVMSLHFDDGWHIWATGSDGPSEPTKDDFMICVYAPPGDEASLTLVMDQGKPARPGLTLERAILAALYFAIIGYDPYADDPAISDDVVARTLIERGNEAGKGA